MIMGRIKIILILIQMAILLKVNYLLFAGVHITFLCCFYFLLQFHQNECILIIILLSTNRVKKGLGPNCPFYGLNLPTVAGIIL